MKRRFATSLLIGAGLLASVFGQTPLKEKLTHKKALNLAVAKEVAAASEAEARKNNWNVSIRAQKR